MFSDRPLKKLNLVGFGALPLPNQKEQAAAKKKEIEIEKV